MFGNNFKSIKAHKLYVQIHKLTNSIAYVTRRFNAAFTRARPSSDALYDISEQRWFLQCEVVSLTPNPQAGG